MINLNEIFSASHLYNQEKYKYATERDLYVDIAKYISRDYELFISELILDNILLEEYEEDIFKSQLPLSKKLKLTKITKMDAEQINSILEDEFELFVSNEKADMQEIYFNSYC
jgi:hypothetical protein